MLHVVNFAIASQLISQKESEKRYLEAQLRDLEKQHKRQETPPFYRQSIPDLWSTIPKLVFKPTYQPQPLLVQHTSPFVSQSLRTQSLPCSEALTSPPSNPTVGASSKNPQEFMPITTENHISSFLKNLTSPA